jgi:hypothetical protein
MFVLRVLSGLIQRDPDFRRYISSRANWVGGEWYVAVPIKENVSEVDIVEDSAAISIIRVRPHRSSISA